MTQKEILKAKAVNAKQSFPSWKQQGAEFFPVASGVQTPYVGQDDSIEISARNVRTLSLSQTDDLCPVQPNFKKQNNQMTRPLGDVRGRFPVETAQKLASKLPQTFLYLPEVGGKRGRSQQKHHLKEIGQNLRFTNEVMELRCARVLEPDEDELRKAVHPGRGRNRMAGVRRHDAHGLHMKHMPCHLKVTHSNQIPKPEAFAKIDREMKQEMEDILFSVAKTSRTNRYSIVKIDKPETPPQETSEWDEYVLALLSKSTAKFLASEFTSGTQHARLVNFLKERYREGEKEQEKVEKEKEVERQKEAHGKKRMSKVGAELEKVLTEAVFDVHYSPSFTLPSAVGNKKLVTDNAFQQEMMAGAFPLRGRRPTRKSIVLNTSADIMFEKRLQANYPENPRKWSNASRRASKAVKTTTANNKVVKGLRRWNQLPSILQDDSYIPSFKSFDEEPVKTLREAELQSAHRTRENNNVLRISEEWRNKWLLEKRWQNAPSAELIRAMNDINDHVRLAAVAACSKVADVRLGKKPEPSYGLPTDKATVSEENLKDKLEPELVECVRKLLDDKCKQVSLTAAVTLCTLDIREEKAIDILVDIVQNGGDIDQWVAAQCLASSGHCSDSVITQLLSQTSSSDLLRQEQAAMLLLKLSDQSSLVHAIVAEQLNSSSCQERLVACRLLPRLKGRLNKDVAQKLSHMMWNDWQKSVRTAAAQALGRTGNGKLVHDALLKRLLYDNERVKVDALRKLANLGIMTTHLLPSFLSCFASEFISVRMEAAVAAGIINTADDNIIAMLVKLANEDHSWKVKAHAIKALGVLGKVTDEVVEMLVWSMRYSKLAAVRAEACNAVAQLGLRDTRALSVLQDRLIVETEEVVRREAKRALKALDVECTGDLDMISAIQNEVKRLCNKDSIVSSILERDKQEDYEKYYQRMIAVDDSTQPRCSPTPLTASSLKSSESLKRGWDPILAGYHARSVMSEPSTPVLLKMERSQLPMDLNSASSEGSLGSKDELDSESDYEYPDSTTPEMASESLELAASEHKPVALHESFDTQF